MTEYTIKSEINTGKSGSVVVRTATIQSVGAELISLGRAGGQHPTEEFMWEGNPEIWSGRAPILFPVVGGLKDGRYRVFDQWFSMPQHGFVRRTEFTAIDHNEESLHLRCVADETSLAVFPWRFQFDVEFSWLHDELQVSYCVTNEDEREMFFNIGSHPAFRLPLGGDTNTQIEDYLIEFSATETLDTYKIVDGLLARQPERFLTADKRFPLSASLFDRDALVFMNILSRQVSLTHRLTGARVIVDTGGAPHLGIWGKPAAPYVCIEPWWGFADFDNADGYLENKAGIQQLAAGASFSTSIGIKTA
ncbi:MAG: aldose 1-epimerase family protein [Gammaproteobacteria bacterium]|nr:aldose 1-epimerase family protein [Gammaproteobacteria bacterium]